MAKVTFITRRGEEVTVTDAEGDLMSVAVANQVEGIDGDCGGVCNCGTCHVQIEPAWLDRTGPATDEEREILDFEEDAQPNSRLSCQIELSAELDGLVVRVVRD